MPSQVFKACLATGTMSNTEYVRQAVCEALARDLQIPLETLREQQPPPRGKSRTLFDGNRRAYPGPSNTPQSVK